MFLDGSSLINGLDLQSCSPPLQSAKWIAVKRQAIRHTRGEGVHDLLQAQRPNESDFIKAYRIAQYRDITNEGVVKFNDKAARILSAANFSVDNQSAELKNYLADKSFSIGNGEQVSLSEYFSRFILPCSFEDPNAILLAFPFNEKAPHIAPAAPIEQGGLEPNEMVGIMPMLIRSEDIKHIDSNTLAWATGDVVELKHKENRAQYPVFRIADRSAYYEYVPVSLSVDRKGNTKVNYELRIWYVHNIQSLPINVLGGSITKDSNSDAVYNESFLKPYFELADEAINTFSDYQAVRVKCAFPVKVIEKQPCSECGGNKMVKVSTKDGDTLVPCSSCEGKGIIQGLSPFKDLVVDKPNGLQKESSRAPLSYVSPPVETLTFLDNAWQNLLSKAKRAINLDLLEDTAESGEAKKQRLQDLQDMLLKIGGNFFDVLQRFLQHTEALLVPNPNNRKLPQVVNPVSYELKSESILSEEVKNSIGADKFTSLMDFFRKKYKGNNVLIRIKELSLMYAPLLMVDNPQELQLRMLGAYNESDLIKRDRVEMLLHEISKDDNFLKMSTSEIFSMIDDLIKPFLPLTAIPLIDSDDGADPALSPEFQKIALENQAKLKGTVGGVTGIIQIANAVAQGTLKESAAEAILMEIYGLDADTANRFIEIGDISD